MKKVLFFSGVLFFITFNFCALGLAENFDGAGWKLLNRYIEGKTMRKVFLQGIYDGAQIMDGDKAREVYYSFDYEKSVSMVDDFYSDSKNLSIPVAQAFYIVSLQLKNRPQSDVDEAIKKIREGYKMQFLKK